MPLIFKTSSVTPDFFYVFNIILSFSNCSQSFKKICTWELLGANVLKYRTCTTKHSQASKPGKRCKDVFVSNNQEILMGPYVHPFSVGATIVISRLPNYCWTRYHFLDKVGYQSKSMSCLKTFFYFSFRCLQFKNSTVKYLQL